MQIQRPKTDLDLISLMRSKMIDNSFLIFDFEIHKNENALLVVPHARIPGVALPPSAPAQPPLTWEEFGRKLELLSEEKNQLPLFQQLSLMVLKPLFHHLLCILLNKCSTFRELWILIHIGLKAILRGSSIIRVLSNISRVSSNINRLVSSFLAEELLPGSNNNNSLSLNCSLSISLIRSLLMLHVHFVLLVYKGNCNSSNMLTRLSSSNLLNCKVEYHFTLAVLGDLFLLSPMAFHTRLIMNKSSLFSSQGLKIISAFSHRTDIFTQAISTGTVNSCTPNSCRNLSSTQFSASYPSKNPP